MGTTASFLDSDGQPTPVINCSLKDLSTQELFIEKHRQQYSQFFNSGWTNDESKKKAVLYIFKQKVETEKISFEKTVAGKRVTFTFDIYCGEYPYGLDYILDEKPEQYSDIELLLRIKRMQENEKIDFDTEEELKIKWREAFDLDTEINRLLKPFFKIDSFQDIEKFILLVKIWYMFTLIGNGEYVPLDKTVLDTCKFSFLEKFILKINIPEIPSSKIENRHLKFFLDKYSILFSSLLD